MDGIFSRRLWKVIPVRTLMCGIFIKSHMETNFRRTLLGGYSIRTVFLLGRTWKIIEVERSLRVICVRTLLDGIFSKRSKETRRVHSKK